MPDLPGVYNSRIVKVYLQYLRKYHPDLNLDSVLEECGIAVYQVEDPAHWFSQAQIDRFYEVLAAKTGDAAIARKAGRFATSTVALGATKQYALGLISPTAIFLLMEKLYPLLSRGADIQTHKIGPHTVEIVSTPKPGIAEKRFQCENRIGFFEAVGLLFSDQYAKIDHPACYHRGDASCHYIISWEKSMSGVWQRIRNATLIVSTLGTGLLVFISPPAVWLTAALSTALLTSLLTCHFERLRNKSLTRTIENQKEAAGENLLESNIRYNYALLVQEIGKATSRTLNVDKILATVSGVMQKRLDFDRGMIMLANENKTRLVYKNGFGHRSDQEALLKDTEFHLDRPGSAGLFVRTMKEQRPFLVHNICEIEDTLSPRSQKFARQLDCHSLICVPLVYENESLGILAVDNGQKRTPLRQSDMNLLMGVASQTAVSIINARSFKQIQQSEKKYRLLADNITDIIWIFDLAKLRFTYVSPSVERKQGYSPAEMTHLGLKDILLPHSLEHARQIIAAELQAEQTGQADPLRSRSLELEEYCKDGSTIWVEVTASFLRDEKGTPIAVLGVSRDISERKKAERQRHDLEAQLRQAHKMEAMGTLAGGIAHDFNNILSAILGYTEISLNDGNNKAVLESNLKEILKAGNRAKELIKQILAFSRQAEKQIQPVQVKLIIKEALKLLRASIPTTIAIRTHLLSDAAVMADPTQIHQVLMNLCTNAEYVMAETGGRLTVSLSDVDIGHGLAAERLGVNPGPYLCLEVSDTGPGISPEVQKRMFDPFFSTKGRGKGTGLGLSVVHGIIKSHGGAITVASQPGKGATFKIFLPTIEKKQAQRAESEHAIPSGKERILLVDDEPGLTILGQQMLEKLGYRVQTRTSSLNAFESFKRRPEQFDLVITDMTMPNMTGAELAQEMLKIRPDIPVILCTGYSQSITARRAKKLGIKAFVMKPFGMAEIARTVRAVLDHEVVS